MDPTIRTWHVVYNLIAVGYNPCGKTTGNPVSQSNDTGSIRARLTQLDKFKHQNKCMVTPHPLSCWERHTITSIIVSACSE